ncbi:4-(cytidine 5'-diphospho)-2-C-methyl-D-erythritol kinase [Mechercharimyces sp. CAU 1602]|uniref:4-(cytidine 5'-diphospho)-2-C-methyl-D-erythritol kinase n=1 Tax=Mechercharimyces sp. CAU 1602 TaxID=2973933 RepID=UPI002163BAF9|nr:4-(cytidine 5'-diphospho)-2-C-methyl-D-erythritol kinase [Mechercharimyces sp. CAU 1602]MCS1352372.1 4-(cytidine 5'-diphospho)-2-C-methyl-D-erythritol kinase [Mechercharimyces sp. CAU 1602]
MEISVKAPAKINLTLDVLHKRDDGYHELEMVMTSIDLADRIDLVSTSQPSVRLRSTSGFVPQDERNLAYRAAALLKENYDVKPGVFITIHKHIPVAAGLAGGSSDAAATLIGLNKLWNLGLTLDELVELGAQIGSDVPYCVHAGTALVRGRGERLMPISSPPACWVVLAKPEHGVSTAEVFQKFEQVSPDNSPDTKAMVAALEQGDFSGICASLGNVLEDVTLKSYPTVGRIKDKMKEFGAEGVLMSGSGPTVFGLVRQEARARRIVNGLRGFCRHVYMVRMLGQLDQNRTK